MADFVGKVGSRTAGVQRLDHVSVVAGIAGMCHGCILLEQSDECAGLSCSRTINVFDYRRAGAVLFGCFSQDIDQSDDNVPRHRCHVLRADGNDFFQRRVSGRERSRRLLATKAAALLMQELLDASNSELDAICAALERGDRTLAECVQEVLKLKLH